MSKFNTVFDKDYTPNWTEVFKVMHKLQQSNQMTYFLEDFRDKHIAGGFYEYELHSVANLDVHLVEKVLLKRRKDLCKMVGTIRIIRGYIKTSVVKFIFIIKNINIYCTYYHIINIIYTLYLHIIHIIYVIYILNIQYKCVLFTSRMPLWQRIGGIWHNISLIVVRT